MGVGGQRPQGTIAEVEDKRTRSTAPCARLKPSTAGQTCAVQPPQSTVARIAGLANCACSQVHTLHLTMLVNTMPGAGRKHDAAHWVSPPMETTSKIGVPATWHTCLSREGFHCVDRAAPRQLVTNDMRTPPRLYGPAMVHPPHDALSYRKGLGLLPAEEPEIANSRAQCDGPAAHSTHARHSETLSRACTTFEDVKPNTIAVRFGPADAAASRHVVVLAGYGVIEAQRRDVRLRARAQGEPHHPHIGEETARPRAIAAIGTEAQRPHRRRPRRRRGAAGRGRTRTGCPAARRQTGSARSRSPRSGAAASTLLGPRSCGPRSRTGGSAGPCRRRSRRRRPCAAPGPLPKTRPAARETPPAPRAGWAAAQSRRAPSRRTA